MNKQEMEEDKIFSKIEEIYEMMREYKLCRVMNDAYIHSYYIFEDNVHLDLSCYETNGIDSFNIREEFPYKWLFMKKDELKELFLILQEERKMNKQEIEKFLKDCNHINTKIYNVLGLMITYKLTNSKYWNYQIVNWEQDIHNHENISVKVHDDGKYTFESIPKEWIFNEELDLKSIFKKKWNAIEIKEKEMKYENDRKEYNKLKDIFENKGAW
jgi:hypothetical protein